LPLALKTPGRSITLSALAAEMDSNQTYHTDPYMYLHWGEFGEKIPAGNIGAYISKPGKDPLITQLAEELTQGLSTPEEKAQKLLDFVSNEVSYSYEDHWYRTEITKRAHEVLLAGQGDCSGKSTLYASLLEVLHIPYCLLYFDRHVNVGVQGKFPRENGYVFELAGATYAMAEPTVEKFRIGITKLQEAAQLREVFYYQIPSNKPEIHDVKRNILLQTTRSLEPEEPETE